MSISPARFFSFSARASKHYKWLPSNSNDQTVDRNEVVKKQLKKGKINYMPISKKEWQYILKATTDKTVNKSKTKKNQVDILISELRNFINESPISKNAAFRRREWEAVSLLNSIGKMGYKAEKAMPYILELMEKNNDYRQANYDSRSFVVHACSVALWKIMISIKNNKKQ